MARADDRDYERSDGTESSEQTTAETGDPATTESDPSACYAHDRGNESGTPEDRAEVLERDKYRCQVCGRYGPENGGLATLHVHHIERDPDRINENALENLTTLCRSCHSWVHQQSSPDEAPVTLSEEDLSVLLPQDIEILRYLAERGPARTGEIKDALTADLSPTAVRERLAVLMGLDIQIESRDRQIVDQDVDTGAWGLPEQIEHSARGHIPADPQTLIQRVEDEQVRQALERGCDRQAVMDILDISRRSTFHKVKRARGYNFPLDAFRRSGNGGQHPEGSASSEVTGEADEESNSADEQQRLDSVVDNAGDSSQADPVELGEPAQQGHVDMSGEASLDEGRSEIRKQLETAISALQRINAEL